MKEPVENKTEGELELVSSVYFVYPIFFNCVGLSLDCVWFF